MVVEKNGTDGDQKFQSMDMTENNLFEIVAFVLLFINPHLHSQIT